VADLKAYRSSEQEQARTSDLLGLLPKGRKSVLDIGARDGHFSKLLAERFDRVTAVDLCAPGFQYPRVECVAGDATRLPFRAGAFDCVFCAEVLEHIPNVEAACREITRVVRHEVVIGVPYREDIRVGRTTCRSCGKPNPPWGHLNTFDDRRLEELFSSMTLRRKSLVGVNRGVTNPLSCLLMDWAGNPWGSYSQDEPCIYCGQRLRPPAARRSLAARLGSALAARINGAQRLFTKPHRNWIHAVFAKPDR